MNQAAEKQNEKTLCRQRSALRIRRAYAKIKTDCQIHVCNCEANTMKKCFQIILSLLLSMGVLTSAAFAAAWPEWADGGRS